MQGGIRQSLGCGLCVCDNRTDGPQRVHVWYQNTPFPLDHQQQTHAHTQVHVTAKTEPNQHPGSIRDEHRLVSRLRTIGIVLWDWTLFFPPLCTFHTKIKTLKLSNCHLSYLLHLHRGSGYTCEGGARGGGVAVRRWLAKLKTKYISRKWFRFSAGGIFFFFFLSKNKI